MMLRWLKILAVLGLCICETTLAQIVNPTEFAKAFNYPAEKLNVTDITQQARDKHGDTIVLAFSISGENRTFAPAIVVVAREGSLLTEKLRHKLAQAMASPAVPPNGKQSVKKLQMPNGSLGYVGMAAFGPGGNEEIAIASIPSRSVDVQMKVSVPYETPLNVTDATKAYHDALANTDGFLTTAMEASIKAVVAQIAQGGALVSGQVPANTTPPQIAPAVTPTPTASIVPPPAPVAPPATIESTPIAPPSYKSTNPLLWIGAAIAALVAMVLILRHKTPKE